MKDYYERDLVIVEYGYKSYQPTIEIEAKQLPISIRLLKKE